MSFHLPATPAEVAAYCADPSTPLEGWGQHHDRVDEQDEHFQEALHQLAARCSACGQPVTEETRR
jgi:hypothetical protein